VIVVDTNLIRVRRRRERLGKPLVSADRRLAKAFPARVLSPEEFVTRG
jgi:hypothetical protein